MSVFKLVYAGITRTSPEEIFEYQNIIPQNSNKFNQILKLCHIFIPVLVTITITVIPLSRKSKSKHKTLFNCIAHYNYGRSFNFIDLYQKPPQKSFSLFTTYKLVQNPTSYIKLLYYLKQYLYHVNSFHFCREYFDHAFIVNGT